MAASSVKCPHCADGTDPNDWSVLIVDDCPVCLGTNQVSAAVARAYEVGCLEHWTWEKWKKERATYDTVVVGGGV